MAVSGITARGYIKPVQGLKPWYDDYWTTMDLIDADVTQNETDIATNVTDIATLTASFNNHSVRHQLGGADEISLTGLSGTSITLDSLIADSIIEKTVDNGIDVDSVILKDGQITVLADPALDLQVATKQYVDSAINGLDWQESTIDIRDFTVNEPVVRNVGDRYRNTATGVGSSTAQAVTINNLYEWNGTNWTEINVGDGMAHYDEDTLKSYIFSSSSWIGMSGIVTHNALAGLQGGIATEYYHLKQQSYDWSEAVTLDADGEIHFPDDKKIHFGALNDGSIEWDDVSSTLRLVVGNGVIAIKNDSININEDLNGVDFIIRKQTAGFSLAYNYSTDDFEINSDITLADNTNMFIGDSGEGSLQYNTATGDIEYISNIVNVGVYFGISTDNGNVWAHEDGTNYILDMYTSHSSIYNYIQLISNKTTGAGSTTFNEHSRDIDFIIEGDTREAYRFDAGDVEHIFKEDTFFENSGSGLPYGEICGIGNASTTPTTTINVWAQFLHYDTNCDSNMATPDHTNDHITIVKTGEYLISYNASVNGGNNKNYEYELKKNNGVTSFTNTRSERLMGSTGDIGSVSGQGLVSLTVGDTIELWSRCTTASPTAITIRNSTLRLVQIGG